MDSADSVALSRTDTGHTVTSAPFPLTAAQRGLWFAQHLMPDVPITIANYIDVHGELDGDLMRGAVEQAAAELGAGSLRLVEIDGEPHQYIDKSTRHESTDLDFTQEPDPEAAAIDWMQAAYSRPIDIIEGPLIRAATLRVGADRTFWYSHVHHIALDGYGAVRLMNRAAEIYTAVQAGESPSVSKAGALEDVYAAEDDYRSSSRFDKDREYWREKTSALPAPVSPSGIVAPPAPRSRICGEPLPETLEKALTRAADRLGSAFAPLAVSAVAAFLSRLTGNDDIVLSLPVAGRTTAVLRRSGGMVSNVLPIRVRIVPGTTVASLVDAVQLELTGALRHQRYRAEDIRRDAGASQEHRGFFGTAINIMAYERQVQFGRETGYFNVLSTGPVEDLSVNIYPPVDGGGSRIDFEANPNVYSAEATEDLYRRFVRLLAQFLHSDPDFAVTDLDLLDDAEIDAVVPARGGPDAPPMLLPDILAAGVARNPDGIALVDGTTELSYTELDRRSNTIARALIARGAGPDSVVAVALPRSIDSVVAFWAAAKSGAAFVPIDPTYPPERIGHMVTDSGVLVGLSTTALADSLPDAVHWLGMDDPGFAGELGTRSDAPISDADRRSRLGLDHTAYMIYTSGSTGTPKGVLVGHRGLSVFTAAQRPELALTTDSRVLRFSSASFDASVFEMLAAFGAGATMVVAPADVHGGSELTELLTQHAVTHIVTAPALLSTVEVEKVESLTSVVVGGDVCPPDLVDRLRSRAELRNSYGPTESTIVITMTEPQKDPRAITIGRPLQGATAVVLDRWLRPVPVGSSGELYVGGPGLARGYHNREGLTSTRFVADPYGSGQRLYRTGDVVRWRVSDTVGVDLEFLGRSDFQVQLHGLRIELGEVDAVLSWHQSVDFVVSTVARRGDRSTLVAYVKTKAGHEFDRDALIALASEFLPRQSVPSLLVEIDSVPITPSGKVDRSALPDPLAHVEAAPFRAASDPVQQIIADAMAEVLGKDSVGVDDSFFALGGDSIVAIQLVSRAKASGVVFTPRDVFERRTVAGLADAAVSDADRVRLEELPGGGVGDLPLLPIAASVLARAEQPTDLDNFHQALVLVAPSDLNTEDLVAALAVLIDHHDALRARLVDDGLVVGPTGSVDAAALVSTECSAVDSGGESGTDLEGIIARAGARLRPRDAVMLQVVHVTDPDCPRIVLVAHHLVVDGVSWRILLPDLVTAYALRESGPTLQPVETSFRRWAHAVDDLPSHGADAWRALLSGDNALLGSRPLDARDTGATTQVAQLAVSSDITQALLEQLPNRYRMGPEDALLASLAVALRTWRGQASHLVSIESHGRDTDSIAGADLTRTVGWFTSTHPVRIDAPSGPDAASVVKAVKEQLRSIPTEPQMFGLLSARDEFADSPAPRISFNYLGKVPGGTPDQPWKPDLTVGNDVGSGSALRTAYELDINALVRGGSLIVRIAFPTGVLDAADVRRLTDLWSDAITELAEHGRAEGVGELTPSDVPLVTVDQARLNLWHSEFGNVSDVWPLTPLQRGLMFHADLMRDGVDPYTAQIVFDLDGVVDGDRLRRAAQRLLDRHENLRTAFVHDAAGLPVQLVVDDVAVPWQEVRTDDVAATIAAERGRRFHLGDAPLIRFALVHGPASTRLVVTNHHILFDGWSMPILIKELLVLYAADTQIGIPVRRYRDFLAWSSARRSDSDVDRWAAHLAGVDGPTLLAGPHVPSGRLPEDVDVRIDGSVLASIARASNVTVNTVVQAAWSIVLSTVLSRDDVVFGATVSGRPGDLLGATEMLGLFINTLPLRVSIDVQDTVESLTERVQREQVELLDVHHVGLADIHAAAGRSADFDTLVVFESYPVDHSALDAATDIAGMAVRGIDVSDSTHYPLTLVTVLEPTPTMTLRFSPDAFSRGQVATFADRLQRAIRAMAERPEGRVLDIDVLGELERQAVTSDWVATEVDCGTDTLVDLLGRSSTVYGSSTCVVYDGHSLTYDNFAARVHCLARYLIRCGIGAESIVAVSLPRSMDQLVAIHAVVHAGAAYLPLDDTLPASRIAYMVDTASPALILGTDIETSVPCADPRTLDLSAFATGPIAQHERPTPVRPGNTAYVLFTSGSTGRPKGVAVSHAAIVNRLLWMQDTYPLDTSDAVLHKTPATFDVSVWELFWPHITGARTVIAEPGGHRDPKYLSRLVRDESVTTAHFVPSMLDLYLDHGDHEDTGSLRRIFASGEALSRRTVQRSHSTLTAELHNLYGPTEAAVDVTYHRTDAAETGPVPIGVPVWNTGVRVLDHALRIVPIGAVGELYLSGVQLARGYTDRAALTSERFVADPHGDGRLYRTGDLVRWTLDGELHYLGRNDFQVKLRGQRLELGEIDEALLRAEGVTAVVVTVHGEGTSEKLVAYVCGDAETDAVRAHADGELPAFMVPTVYVPLARLPLGRNGKLDRSALPEPSVGQAEHVAPDGAAETAVAQIFADVLGVDGVGVTASWFELGGNSLTATQVVARMNAELQGDLGVRDLFEEPTVRGLTTRLNRFSRNGGGGPALVRRDRPAHVPLAPNQHRMWLLNRFDPASGAYNIAGAVRLTGVLDAEALVESVFDVVDRHEALRTFYPDSESGKTTATDGPRQVVVDSDFLDVSITTTTEAGLPGAVAGLAVRGFDVTERPPVRAAILRLAADDHVLVVVTHHIAADGWSMRPLARDVMIAYTARAATTAHRSSTPRSSTPRSSTPPWPALEVQYTDYALWKIESLGSEQDPESVAARQLSFWRGELAGVADHLPLPIDRPRPPTASHRGETVTFAVAPDTRRALTELARHSGATEFMVLHAALAIMLARVSGTSDITVGTPVAGRGERALDDLVGMFVGTLTLRSDVDPAAPFTDLLASVRDRDLAAYGNADIPFDRVVEELTPVRSTAHHPLFQVMLSLEDPVPTVELPELTVAPLAPVGAVAKFDLQLAFESEDLTGTLTYATDLFDAGTARSFAELFRTVLDAVVADPRTIVGDIDLVSVDPLRGTPSLRHRTLPDALSAAVVSSAGGTAVVSGSVSIDYPALDDASTRIARQLIARGAGPETAVAIALPRGITAMTMLWAVAKTGAAFVPVDPRYPHDRILHIITDSGARLGISDMNGISETYGSFGSESVGVDWIHPDELDPTLGSAFPITDRERNAALSPHHPAYVIYTSGSTGTPKGVSVTHAGFADLGAELVERLGLHRTSRTLHFASPSFDASILELLLAIGSGSTMHIADPQIYGGAELAAALDGVTHAFLTPAAAATIDPPSVPDLRVLVVGGEACGPDLISTWADRVSLFNAYGPTESTVVATMSDPMTVGAPIRIGAPTRGIDAYVLDARLHPVPTGVVGELYLGGGALARGYHAHPATTAASFVANPFDPRGHRLYRTGDQVRRVGDALEYHGRIDHQVKIRGFRIELGEVDAVLTRHPGVEQSVSIVHADSVVSYVVVSDAVSGGHAEPSELVEHARRSLPAHMVPQAVTIIDEVPRTPTGKTDRTALPAPVFATREFLAPRTPTETVVSEVFGAVFGAARVGVDDDFFDLGGNSLVATRVMAHVNERVGRALPVRALFEAPTPAQLAVVVDASESSALPALRPGPRPEVIPLSAAQRRMWLLNQAEPASAAYNIAFAVRLSGELDADALAAAVRDVLDRHESLRTVYPVSGDPHQVILPADDVELDLAPQDIDESAVLASAAAVLNRGFDVTAAVPLRGSVLRTSPTDYVLLLVVHHIAADGLSMGPLARDVVTAYAARTHGAPAPWEPLPVQYADFALWQANVLGSADDPESVLSTQLDYWRTRLDGLPDVLDLPTDRPRPAVSSQRGAEVAFDIGPAVASAIRSLAHRHSASVFMVAGAAYAVLLARLSGTTDIPIGTTVAGRSAGSLDDVVGMFVGTVVLRNEIRPGESFADLLDRVRSTNLEALENADVPFEQVVETLRPTRATSHSPLFQALLAFEPDRPSTLELPGLTVSEFPYESGVTRFDLALTLRETADGLGGSLRYSTDLFDAATIEGFVDRFTRILTAAVENPAQAVGDIDILAPFEREPVRGPDAVSPRTLTQLIGQAVAQNPDGVAIRWNGEDHTYREADDASTRLARVLLGYGIGPETVVAIGLPRSVDSVLTVWAVTKTGAAYVPVDPAYPQDRLQHMVSDSGAVMGITLTSHRSALPGDITWLEIDDPEIRSEVERAPRHPVAAEELNGVAGLDSAAYMIYTSGSTGLPKGVVVSHRGLANLAESRREVHRIEQSSRFLHNTSPSFDMAVGEMVSALSAAATLVVSPPEILGGEELAAFLRDESVTHTLTTPSTLSTLDPSDLDTVQVVCVGGEACSPELIARWAPGRIMVNGYGPTEATDISTLGEITADAPIDIGRPVAGLVAHVLDGRLHPVPDGVPGELYVGGPAVARGYHGRPGLTSTRFLADPISGGRMYRTGDIVRRTPDGRLRYSGRSDTQIKIRGFRIELGEIDAALSTHPGVDFAVTVGHGMPSGETVLVSYILGDRDAVQGDAVQGDALRSYLRKRLPGYMIPASVTYLTTVPRTPTGKLDAGALPPPDFGRDTGPNRLPSTATERLVTEAFSEVLAVNDISVTDDFFDRGGSSLTAMRVLSKLRASTGTALSLQALLAEPTPESIATLLDSGSDGSSSFDVVFPIRTTGDGVPLFCIHPIVGLSWCYNGLDKYTDRPIYGIQTPAPSDLPNSLDALAQRYIDEIEKILPDGPYHLLGWSLGGTIAHAMAVRLRAQGKTVGSLVLLDSHAVQNQDVWETELPAADLLDAVGITMPGIDGFGPGGGQRIRLDSLPSLVAGSGIIETHEVERLIAAARHNHELAVGHTPGVYDGDVLFVSAGHEELHGLATWHPYVTGDISNFSVSHTHWQMTSPSALRAVGPLVARHLEVGA
ncbi:non-ribosomal peptide synthetase [Rhodococcus sp. RS1C4]|nr:non-ribosomal peptide synthetase [Rhodococcus sp. RS1C4]OZC54373.1 non-ribosomal peptide synthetase [Rhodococcus sp. RS1C4]